VRATILTLAGLGAGLIAITVLVVLILGQYDMSGEMRGIVIGALLVALAGVIGQLVTAGVKSWQDKEQHTRDTEDRSRQWDREDAQRAAQWERENQLADEAERRAVSERIWERRADAYDDLLEKLGELRETAQKQDVALRTA
jgi:hypothetical protein